MRNLKPLCDGDIFLYEIGFGAETGWRELTNDPEAFPPWSYVESMLHTRIENIKAIVDTKAKPLFFITDGDTFRHRVATVKPYKGTRKEHKPWHYANLKAYIKGCLPTFIANDLEADDLIAMVHTEHRGKTIICSRDKDLKQVPGWTYSWELGKQPQFGPLEVGDRGTLSIDDKNKLTGTGLIYFYSQVLTGDAVDNIPGLPKCGPVAAYNLLTDATVDTPLLDRVRGAYRKHYEDPVEAEQRLIEQGQLCWIVRRTNGDGTPQIWYPGLEN